MKYKEINFSRKDAKAQRQTRRGWRETTLRLPLRLCAFAGEKTFGLMLLLLVLTPLILSACGGSSALEDKSKIHVGIVFDIGGKDDRSFNAAAWEGVQRAAKDYPNIQFAIIDGVSQLPNVASLVFKEHEGS